MKKSRSFRIIVLLAWTLGILAPFYSASRVFAPFRIAFDRVFQTQASHIIMHMFLYAVLAALIMSLLFGARLSTLQLIFYALTGTAAVAILQEVVQMLIASAVFGSDEVLDVFVDLSGGLLGAMIYLKSRKIEGSRS